MRSSIVLLALAACSQVPDEIRLPRPVDILLRVSVPQDSVTALVTHRGTLIFVDADSVVLSDRRAGARAAVRPDSGMIMEIYRGQKVTGNSIAKGAAIGALFGFATGAAEGLVSGGVSKLFGGWADVGESIRIGASVGAGAGVVGGAIRGATEGDAAWERITLTQLRQELCRCAHP